MHVKSGDGHGGWKGEIRNGNLFSLDPLWRKSGSLLKGLGKKMADKLKQHGIHTLSQLRDVCDNDLLTIELVGKTQGLSKKKMKEWQKYFSENELIDGAVQMFDFRTALNPFKERYGEEWETYIAKTEGCRGKVSINKLIDHMFEETKKIRRHHTQTRLGTVP